MCDYLKQEMCGSFSYKRASFCMSFLKNEPYISWQEALDVLSLRASHLFCRNVRLIPFKWALYLLGFLPNELSISWKQALHFLNSKERSLTSLLQKFKAHMWSFQNLSSHATIWMNIHIHICKYVCVTNGKPIYRMQYKRFVLYPAKML